MKTITATVVTATMAMTAGQTMAAAATAAAAPAPAATAPVNIVQGPPITGLCFLSGGEAQGTSLYGKAIDKQLDVINTQTNNELKDVQSKAQAELTKLQSSRSTMTELAYNQAMLTLQDKANSFNTLVQQRQAEVNATEDQQNKAFAQELQKIAVKVYQDQKCSVLLDRDASVMINNPAMDITTAVVKAMDADKTTVAPFTRVNLPPPPAATGG